MKSHAANFNGESQFVELALNVFWSVGLILGIIYLFMLGYRTEWYIAIGAFIVNIMFQLSFAQYISKFVNKFVLSVLGFIAVPIFGILMYNFLPVNGK